MADLEGVGEAVTGGMLGRAVEPSAGEPGHMHERSCLNCGCKLVGSFCHCCGQKAHVHRTIGAWWHDFLHSVLHLDGKFWRTLPMLAWRPGELTRRYAHGERARFISPLALFLFTVFLMFAVVSLLGPSLLGSDPTGIQASFDQEVRSAEQRVEQLERERAEAVGANGEVSMQRYDDALASARDDLAKMRSVRERGVQDASTISVSDDLPVWMREAAAKAAANPSLMLYKLQANAYKFSWALIPISVPFVWILFLHRRRYRREFTGYDHLVFVTYSIAFMSLMLVALVVIKALGLDNQLLDVAIMLVPPIHIYRQLRGAYELSVVSALWRMLVLLIFANLALSFFVMLLLAIGVLG